MVLEIFKIALHFRDPHIFMWQSKEILNVFNTLILKQNFWKTKTFFKKVEYQFLVESTKIKNKMHRCHSKLPCQKQMLRQIEWWVRNGPITKNGVLPVTTLFLRKFCFSLRNSCKELFRCSNNPNVHIYTFCKRWNFIWRWFFPVSILKYHNCGQSSWRWRLSFGRALFHLGFFYSKSYIWI